MKWWTIEVLYSKMPIRLQVLLIRITTDIMPCLCLCNMTLSHLLDGEYCSPNNSSPWAMNWSDTKTLLSGHPLPWRITHPVNQILSQGISGMSKKRSSESESTRIGEWLPQFGKFCILSSIPISDDPCLTPMNILSCSSYRL